MYTVQVLLSTYNGETYLKQQLDSILNQKNVAVKLFVRDDGSSDGTVDILRAYAALHDNICYLCGENCGVVASFFRLFELSDPDGFLCPLRSGRCVGRRQAFHRLPEA